MPLSKGEGKIANTAFAAARGLEYFSLQLAIWYHLFDHAATNCPKRKGQREMEQDARGYIVSECLFLLWEVACVRNEAICFCARTRSRNVHGKRKILSKNLPNKN